MCCQVIHDYWTVLPVGLGLLLLSWLSVCIASALWNSGWVVRRCDGELVAAPPERLRALRVSAAVFAGVSLPAVVARAVSSQMPWALLGVAGVLYFVMVVERFAGVHADKCSCGADPGF